MLILYTRTGCPFCEKVKAALAALGLSYDERNIADPALLQELLRRGGKRQVPFLIDEKTGKAMYESDDIIRYLEERYGQ
ncbi:MAG: glutathione S-transferase N-terminal domain-containing protein [Parcubacteria group bacterium]|nr:glutathione S-transferase N-terminal domain-containing protein [Parcubacteria group bacterium]